MNFNYHWKQHLISLAIDELVKMQDELRREAKLKVKDNKKGVINLLGVSPFHCAWIPSSRDHNPSLLHVPDSKLHFWWKSWDYVQEVDSLHCSRSRRAWSQTYTECNSKLHVWNATCPLCCAYPSCSKLDCKSFWTCHQEDCQHHCTTYLPTNNRDRPRSNLVHGRWEYRSTGLAVKIQVFY